MSKQLKDMKGSYNDVARLLREQDKYDSQRILLSDKTDTYTNGRTRHIAALMQPTTGDDTNLPSHSLLNNGKSFHTLPAEYSSDETWEYEEYCASCNR